VAIEYCNITTDLQRVCANIEQYQSQEILEGWTKTTGQTNVYQLDSVGYVSQVFEDGVQMTVKTSVALADATASTFYYDTDKDILYIHTSGSDAPSGYTITNGEDWDGFKTAMRNQAQEMVDNRLSSKYVVPLQPKSRSDHTSNAYEYDIVRITALLTCSNIIRRVDPNDPIGLALYKEAWNPDPEVDEMKGLINQLMDGDISLSDQITTREAGGWNVYPYASNSVTVAPIFYGPYLGSKHEIWRVEIDTAGAVGTATWKVSYDGGSNWDLELQDTRDDDNNQVRFYIANGIYVYFPVAEYGDGDYWDLELFPMTDEASNAKMFTIGMSR
jgi:hypothetical protein